MIERRTVRDLAGLRAAYDATYARTEYGERPALYRQVRRLLGAPAGALVLDVGCGAGAFARAAPDLRVVGLDLSGNALLRARQAGVPRLVHGQGERLPVRDACVRHLVCLGNLEHFLDPEQGARELARALAPGGRGVVMLPNAYYSGDLWRLVRTGQGPDHHQAIDRFATCGEWRALLERGGLAVAAVERWDKGKRWKRLFPFQLAYHFVFAVTPAAGG